MDKSVVGQIRHILLDKQRLVRRTQLKRSLYRVLGKYDTEREEQEETDDRASQRTILKRFLMTMISIIR